MILECYRLITEALARGDESDAIARGIALTTTLSHADAAALVAEVCALETPAAHQQWKTFAAVAELHGVTRREVRAAFDDMQIVEVPPRHAMSRIAGREWRWVAGVDLGTDMGGMRDSARMTADIQAEAAKMRAPLVQDRSADSIGPTHRPGARRPGHKDAPPVPRWARKRDR